MEFPRKRPFSFHEYFLFIFSFFWYLYTLFPTIYGGDTGELIVSAHILGIPHAPGYPLYNLLAKSTELLIPWGNPAYHINLLSALLGAATLVLFYKLMILITAEQHVSFAAALYLCFMPIFHEQSIVAEVFMLNACIAVALILIAVRIKGAGRLWYAAFFLYGLGMGNHHTLILIIPALHVLIQPQKKHIIFLIYIISFLTVFSSIKGGVALYLILIAVFYIYRPFPASVWRMVVVCGLWFMLGLSVYLYLPIRARVNPAINFGDPDTLSSFWAVLTRREFGSFQLHPTALYARSVVASWGQMLGYMATMIKNIGLPGLLISCGGMLIAAFSGTRLLFVLLLFIIPGPLFILFSNLSPNTLALWRLERFHLIPLIAQIMFFGIACGWLIRSIRSKLHLRLWHEYSMLGIIILFCVYPLDRFAHSRTHFYLRDFGNNLLKSVEPQGRLILDTKLFDEFGSSLAYASLVEGKRSDITIISRSGTMFANIYGDDFQYLKGDKRFDTMMLKERELIGNTTQPIYYAAVDRAVLPEKEGAYQFAGLLNKRGKLSVDPANLYIRRELSAGWAVIDDYPTRLIMVHYPYFYAKKKLEQLDPESADTYLAACMRYGYNMEWLLYNIGSIYSQEGNLASAERYFFKALDWDPFFPDTYFGLGFVYYRKKEFARAERAYLKTLQLNPDFSDAYYNLGIVQWEMGKKDSAKQNWTSYLAYKPNSTQADQIKELIR